MHFFLLLRKADIGFILDVDLALKQSDENPMCYMQYAHTHICLVFEHAGVDAASFTSTDLIMVTGPNVGPQAITLVQYLTAFPDMLADAARELIPHAAVFYLCDLADGFHAFRSADRVLVGNKVIRRAHLALLATTRQMLYNGLVVIGVPAPRRI